MKWWTEAIGILLCVQGIGGAATALLDGGRSWFLVRYTLPEGAAQVAAGVVIALAGGLVLLAGSRRRGVP